MLDSNQSQSNTTADRRDIELEAIAASRRTASMRQQKARAKYVAMLPKGGIVSKYSGHLNVKYPNDMLRRMLRYGLIRKARFIPGHCEYEVV